MGTDREQNIPRVHGLSVGIHAGHRSRIFALFTFTWVTAQSVVYIKRFSLMPTYCTRVRGV